MPDARCEPARDLTAPGIELPPPFRLVTLREVGDAFAHASAHAAEEGAGTLVYVGRFDLAEFAVVLEPDEPLRAGAPQRSMPAWSRSRDALDRACAAGNRYRVRLAGRDQRQSSGWSAAAGWPGRSGPTKTSRRTGWCSAG